MAKQIKRKDIDYFLDIAKAISKRSKDPSTKVGAKIVRADLSPVSEGYNGFVQDCDESLMSFDRPKKYKLTLHAEANACLFAREDLSGCIAFVTHAPCSACLLLLFQSKIKEIYYDDIGPIARYEKLEIDAIISIIKANPSRTVKDKDGNDLLDTLLAIKFREEYDIENLIKNASSSIYISEHKDFQLLMDLLNRMNKTEEDKV